MSRESKRSQVRSWKDVALDTTDERLNDDELWYLEDDLDCPSIPGLEGDAHSAAYILQAVEALSRPTVTPQGGHLAFRPPNTSQRQTGSMRHRKRALSQVHYHQTRTHPLNKNYFEDMVVANIRKRASRDICSTSTIFPDSSDSEASSIRTDSSPDGEYSTDEELLGSTTLRLRKSSNAILWNNAEFRAVTSIMSPRHTSISRQPEKLEVVCAWPSQQGKGSRMLYMCLVTACVLSRFYWARYRTVVRGTFLIGAYFVTLAGIVVSIKL